MKTLETLTITDFADLDTEYLRQHHVQHVVTDLIICFKDKIALTSWLEDIRDDPDAYPDYTYDEVQTFFLCLLLFY